MDDSEEQKNSIEKGLKDWFLEAKKTVIVGIGNPFRKDDFVGVEIVRNLKRMDSKNVYFIEAETIPESYMQKIVAFKPTHILLIDAGIINKEAGTAMLADPTQLMRKTSISTHTLPLRIFCDYLTQATGAKICLLIIQPLDTSFGEGLTKTLKNAATNLTTLLQKCLP